jgi:NADH:ubiquinone oxidoreductase subunit 4 (subunit M)
MFFLGFISKVPMMPAHIWLPEVHVEASTVGSVILAAIILKIGFYGLIRVFEMINSFDFTSSFYQIFAVLCLCSLFYGGFIAIRQVDLKKIVAYSSIVHMNIGMLALCNISLLSHSGSLYIMFSHGLISAGMFFCVGFLYERYHTRNIMYFGGLIQYMPIFGVMFILILLSNMSLPGTCNFIGEFIVFFSILKEYGRFVCLCCLSSTFFTSIFCILIFGKVLFYKITGFLSGNLKDLDRVEFGILFNLLYFIFIFGLAPNLLLEFL